eukprot:XP_010662799.1 PREDICTED: receptor-like protein 12 [Vitis vinifera]
MGPKFPTWLQTQTSLRNLDISKSGIVDIAPTWFWKWASHIEWIYLSDNQISGDLSGVWLNNTIIYLNSNCFTGLLPAVSPNVTVLNMANNSFSGPISHFLCQKLKGRSKLEALDLSNNDLSGELPLCWKSWQSLTHVNLGNNNFSGKIPDSISSLFSLKALHLQNNGLSGSIPSSLRGCTSLGLLDLSGNKLLGNVPNWIGELSALKVLCLRSNKFIAEIPSQICQLSSLIVLDVSDNELSGIIPRCLNNFSLMAAIETPDDLFTDLDNSNYELEGLVLMTVGRELEYKGILKYVRMVDLSSNNFSGSIPTELSQLFGLRFLNVSKNHLMGRIPEKIGRMTSLLSLDLSTNHLSGEIPQSLADLTFLNRLNLSCNQFRGRIPLSTQLQSFDAFSYIGNAQLCGVPLTKNCTEDDESQGMDTIDENEEGSEMRWFYISMGLGFIVGFWGVCGALLLKKSWRHAYFQFLYDIRDWVYVAVAIRLNWFHDNLRRLLGLVLTTVGRELEYKGILKYVRMVDLSSEIPQSLADLTFLNRLNLSCNQFWGRIPLSTQLQSFDAFSYIGNAQLCGVPLTKNCTEDDESQGMDTIDENEEGSEMRWFYISMGLGFIVGFWGVCGALLFKKSWRHAYFQFLYDIRDWVYVAVAIRLNWFRDNLRRLLGLADRKMNWHIGLENKNGKWLGPFAGPEVQRIDQTAKGREKAELLGAADGTRYGWLAARRGEQRGQKREKEDPFEGAGGGSAERKGVRKAEQSSRSQTHGFSDLFLGRSPLRCEPRRFF